MNEIERAIEGFKMDNALLGEVEPGVVERNNLAIAALRAEEEREKGCEICRDVTRLHINKSTARLEYPNRRIDFGMEAQDAKFCFRCGHKLDGGGQDEPKGH